MDWGLLVFVLVLIGPLFLVITYIPYRIGRRVERLKWDTNRDTQVSS